MKPSIIIGLSGTFAAGKDTLAQYLVDTHGFVHVSTSDLLREDTMALYGSTDRPVLFEHANELRQTHGPGVLVDKAIARKHEDAQGNMKLVISGIRSIGEVDSLHEACGVMLFIDADSRVRYNRAFSRQRDVEAGMSFDEFIASEKKELEKPRDNIAEQNLFGVRDASDHVIANNTEPAELYASFEALNLL